MVTARTQILKHIWENSGGYINNYGNIILLSRMPLDNLGICVNTEDAIVERRIVKGRDIAVLKGLMVSRGKCYLYKMLTGVCIDNSFYIPIDKSFKTTRLSNGGLVDTYMFALSEQYLDDEKKRNNK